MQKKIGRVFMMFIIATSLLSACAVQALPISSNKIDVKESVDTTEQQQHFVEAQTDEIDNVFLSATEGSETEINTLLKSYKKEYNHDFKLATKEIEEKLLRKWKVGETLGYSLKYDITGGALYDGKLNLSKDTLVIEYLQPGLDENSLTTGELEYIPTIYKNPVFAYYQETMEQMKQDDFLDNYSGVEGIKSNSKATVIIALGIPPDSQGSYELVLTKFIIIEDYVIAVDQSSFYQLIQLQ